MKNQEIQGILSGMLSSNLENTEHADNIQKITNYIDELEKPNDNVVSIDEYNKLKQQFIDRFFSSGTETNPKETEEKPKPLSINSLFK